MFLFNSNLHIAMFKKFTDEQFRIAANLAQTYDALVNVRKLRACLPSYMKWKTVGGVRYLYKGDSQTRIENSLGRESESTLAVYDSFHQRRDRYIANEDALLEKMKAIVAQYRALKLPMVMSLPAKILQEMDANNLMPHFLVAGSFGFAAYEMEAGERFMTGIEETEDFDLSWKAAGSTTTIVKSLQDAIKNTDKTFSVLQASAHKIRNDDAFDVDVICATGSHFKNEVAIKNKIFGDIIPVELPGQDILHLGHPLRHIVVGFGGIPCPLTVPDPRCMAIHKLWLSEQPDRDSLKKRKDGKQAHLLWQACQKMGAYSTDNFANQLPEKWLPWIKKLDAVLISKQLCSVNTIEDDFLFELKTTCN